MEVGHTAATTLGGLKCSCAHRFTEMALNHSRSLHMIGAQPSLEPDGYAAAHRQKRYMPTAWLSHAGMR